MAENSALDVSTWIKRLDLDFKDSIAPYGLSCVFPYRQIRADEPLLCVIGNYWVPTPHVFHFNGEELCPTIEEFGAIIGELDIDDLMFPTMGGDLPSQQVVLGIPLATENRWCVFGKLNHSLVFAHFFGLALPMGKRPCSYILRAFCLLLQGTSWSKGHIVWTSRCAWWSMS